LFSVTAFADHHAPNIEGIETNTGNFDEGNGLQEVLAAAKRWNKFASKNFSKPN